MASHSIRKSGLGSLTTLDLENRWLKVRLLPDLGAKIYDVIWKPTGRNFLWHNPRIAPQPYPIEADFDNYWCGGWDDAFPTCDECVSRSSSARACGCGSTTADGAAFITSSSNLGQAFR